MFGRMDRGGAESMIMNLYRNIDRDIVQFDFVVHTDDVCAFDEEIVELGGRIFHIPRFNGKNIFKYIYAWKKLFCEHSEWKIVHAHIRSTAAIIIVIAKINGCYSIAHSHSISSGKGLSAAVKNIMQFPIRYVADYFMACSTVAGNWLFGKKICTGDKYTLFPNAIDTRLFSYNLDIRNKLRDEMGLHGKKVIGHVGRFEYPKNHIFLITLFSKLYTIDRDVVLVLVGDGSLKNKIKQIVEDYHIGDRVVFYGLSNKVYELVQAFDIMVFPSLYEGFPVSLIEAQASGLPIIGSKEAIPDEAVLTNRVERISLTEKSEVWIDAIEKNVQKKDSRDQYSKCILEAGFDIVENARRLEQFYLSKIK